MQGPSLSLRPVAPSTLLCPRLDVGAVPSRAAQPPLLAASADVVVPAAAISLVASKCVLSLAPQITCCPLFS